MHQAQKSEKILCVDLDGTLLKTDCLVEACFSILWHKPYLLFLFPYWLAKGKLTFKEKVFGAIIFSSQNLPENLDVIEIINKKKNEGFQIYMVTATPLAIAKPIAESFKFFDGIFASENGQNLTGKAKATFLEKEFGKMKFSYIGNSHADIPVWKLANEVIAIAPGPLLLSRIHKFCPQPRIIPPSRSLPSAILKSLRPHQWLKNSLVFVPLILSRQIGDWDLVQTVIMMFFNFSMVSSSLYIFNDLLDLQADRIHPDNCRRPLASGDLPLPLGLATMGILLTLGVTISYSISPFFFSVLITYGILSATYSLWLKSIVLIDILALASLYTIRIFAGSDSLEMEISSWLVTFSGFLFLSLAMLKRCSELIIFHSLGKKGNIRRGYVIDDLMMLKNLGTSSGYISILVFALYINSPIVSLFYTNPKLLWFICPVLFYWVSRMWLKASRGEIPSDPLYFAFKDAVSYYLILIITLLWLAAGISFESGLA